MKTTPANLRAEYDAARKKSRDFLFDYDSLVKRYHSTRYMAGQGGKDDPENHAFEVIQLVLPLLAGGTPQVDMQTSLLGPAELDTLALEAAVNQWAVKTRHRSLVECLGTDFLMKHAIAHVVTEQVGSGEFDLDDPVTLPRVRRLSLKDYVEDADAQTPDATRWRGHRFLLGEDDLERAGEEAGWNMDVVRQIPATRKRFGALDDRDSSELDRGDKAFIEMWVPDAEIEGEPPPPHHHGVIFTMAEDGNINPNVRGTWPRKPRYFHGHPRGPYVKIDGYYVPDQSLGVTMLTATWAQAEYLNAISSAIKTAVLAYKRILAIDATADPDLEEKIRDIQHDGILTIRGLADLARQIGSFEVGGPPDIFFVAKAEARQSLDRNSGIGDATRGNVTGDPTATEVLTAAASTTARLGLNIDRFKTGLAEIFERVAYALYYDDDTLIALGPEHGNALFQGGTDRELHARRASQIMGREVKPEHMLTGRERPERHDSFAQLDIRVSPMSMAYPTEQIEAQRFQAVQGFIALHMPMLMQFPQCQWEDLFREAAKRYRTPWLERFPQFALSRLVASQLIGMQLEGQQVEQPPQVRLSNFQGPKPLNITANAQPRPSPSISGGLAAASAKPPAAPGPPAAAKPAARPQPTRVA